MSELEKRIRDKSLLSKVTTTDKVIPLFAETEKRRLNLGLSGFTPVGYPKTLTADLADHVEKNNLQGKWVFNFYTGASIGAEVEDRWTELGMIDKRWPYQTSKSMKNAINSGQVKMGDKHLSMFSQDLEYGFYTKGEGEKLDYAIIEASAIDENGNIILAGSVGASPEIIQKAEKIIVEINTHLPSFEGMHDIWMSGIPPHKQPIPIITPRDRIGTTYVPTDKSKIIAIIESTKPDNGRAVRGSDAASDAIAQNIIDFLEHEVKAGRLPKNLLPLQSGVGSIANAVVMGLTSSPFDKLTVYTEVLQDAFLPFMDSGKCEYISATSLSLSNEAFEQWWSKYDEYKQKVILRQMSVSNHPEVVRRLGVISMNTPVEFDMYAHVNSSLAGGVKMINGIGGSGDFCRNAYLSIMHAPSFRASKTDEFGISSVVTQVPHVDHTEHDLDVLVTEQGLADVRGMAPKDRAKEIITKCAHPEYKDYLFDYLERATIKTKSAHEPQILKESFAMHTSLEENGTMRFWKK